MTKTGHCFPAARNLQPLDIYPAAPKVLSAEPGFLT